MRQQFLHFVLDQGPERSMRRVALLLRRVANGLKRIQQVPIFSNQQDGQRRVRKAELIG